MPLVAGVQLRYSKTLWFDPAGTTPEVDDLVVVKTSRGEELGQCRRAPFELDDPNFEKGLKPVLRIANERDLKYQIELDEKEKEAMPVFVEMIEKFELDMRPVDVEFLISGDKVVFYFSAEKRVDFRELVRALSSHFDARIDMRQVGVRDEARMIGGLGHCGEQLCCARLSGEFAPVSIKMAKEQGLPLNPTKISGLCGRLMCCLRYEVEAYKDFNRRAPRKGCGVEASDGSRGRVSDLDAVREMVSLRFMRDEMPDETITVKLGDMVCEKEGKSCRCTIDAAVLEETRQISTIQRSAALVGNARFLDKTELGGSVGGPGSAPNDTSEAATRKGASRPGESKGGSKEGGSRRRRGRRRKSQASAGSGQSAPAKPSAPPKDDRVPRRRHR
ncbi:MAG: hypothetical protein FWC48_03960 [Actinomycetia bacterium]|nr:hypothetical protein [Actinomycetes bacterium]